MRSKDQIRTALIERARARQTISYSDLVRRIKATDLQSPDPRLDELLCQIAADETGQGRGMLSVLVVHKTVGPCPIGSR